MATKSCTSSEVLARIVAIESGLKALRQVLDERDERYKQRAESQDLAVKSALETSEKAITKAEFATEKRFDSVNEFRATLADQASKLMPRAEFDVQHGAVLDRIRVNEERIGGIQSALSSIQARGTGVKDAWGYLVGIMGLILAAITVYFRH